MAMLLINRTDGDDVDNTRLNTVAEKRTYGYHYEHNYYRYFRIKDAQL